MNEKWKTIKDDGLPPVGSCLIVTIKNSRRKRRNCKDEAMRFELIVSFFDEPAHKGTLNKLRQVLGRQRKQEKFLESEREYKPRILSE